MDLRSKYANYRYSNYMQEGLAVLKVGSSVEVARSTNNGIIGRNNNILYAKRELENSASSPSKSHGASSTTRERKKPYDDKAIRTTKNFIGKSCYNVGRPSKIFGSRFSLAFLLSSFSSKVDSHSHRDLTYKSMFAVRRERLRLQTTGGGPGLQHAATGMPVDGKTLRGSRIPGQRLVAILLPPTGQIHRMEATDGQKSPELF